MVNAQTWEFLVIYMGYMLMEFQITEIPLNTWSKHFIAFNAEDSKNINKWLMAIICDLTDNLTGAF